MNRKLVGAFLVGIVLGGVAVLSVVASQERELDPVKLAPHIYETALENEQVRVLKVTARPGQDPPVHSHPDRVLISVNECKERLPADGDVEKVTYEAGDVSWEPAATHGEPSTVVNECRFIEVELK